MAAGDHPHARVLIRLVQVEVHVENGSVAGKIGSSVPVPRHFYTFAWELEHHGIPGGDEVRTREPFHGPKDEWMGQQRLAFVSFVDDVLYPAQHLSACSVAEIGRA